MGTLQGNSTLCARTFENGLRPQWIVGLNPAWGIYEGVFESFRTGSITKHMLTTINT